MTFERAKKKIQKIDDIEFKRARIAVLAEEKRRQREMVIFTAIFVSILVGLILFPQFLCSKLPEDKPGGRTPYLIKFDSYLAEAKHRYIFISVVEPKNKQASYFHGNLGEILNLDDNLEFNVRAKIIKLDDGTIRIKLSSKALDAWREDPPLLAITIWGADGCSNTIIINKTIDGYLTKEPHADRSQLFGYEDHKPKR